MSCIDPELFKAYDIRSTVDRLTPEVAELMGRALAAEALVRSEKKIVLGRDARLSSPDLAQALARGLAQAGMTVLDLGLVTTPMLYFAATQLACGCGVMVTGSHNPPQYNGIKIMLSHDVLDGFALRALQTRIEHDDYVTAGPGGCVSVSVTASYREAIAQVTGGLSRPIRVVVDCGHSVPSLFAPELYQSMGAKVIPLYCELDGHFPRHHPDPQVPGNLADLQAMVVQQQADVGLAFDGDGDRLGVVTAAGRFVPSDRLLMLLAAQELQIHDGGLVLYDVKSTGLLPGWVLAHGGTSAVIPTGHSHMKRQMRQRGALLAGELSGHFAFSCWGMDDGIFAGLKVLQLVADGLDLDAALADLPIAWATPELQVAIGSGGHAYVERIARDGLFPTAERVVDVDGLRIEYAGGFGLIRASNTQPILTLRIEADALPTLWRIRDELAAAIAPLELPDLELDDGCFAP